MIKAIQKLLVFKEAKARTSAGHLFRTLAQALVFWTVFFGALPVALHLLETHYLVPHWNFPTLQSRWLLPTGAGLFCLFGAGNLWAGVTMAVVGEGTPFPLETARNLVVRGPYRFVRNPMALGGLGAGGAIAIALGSPLMAAAILAGGVVWHVVARPPEEADLAERFGESYRAYAAAVPLWIPRLSPYVASTPPHGDESPPC